MRLNTRQTYEAWKAGKARKPAPSIWTDGVNIYSYGQRIVINEGPEVLFNSNSYSRTTSCHQNALRSALQQDGIKFGEWETDS